MKYFLWASIALSLSACMKEPELKPDFGPEITSAEFSKALAQVEVPDPSTIKKDEYAYFVRSTVVQDQMYQLDKRWAYTVTDKRPQGQDFVLTFVKELHEYDQGKEKISQEQDEVLVGPASAPASTPSLNYSPLAVVQDLYSGRARALSFSSEPASPARGILSKHSGDIRTRATSRVTFHNLKLEKTSVPVPEFVQQRANCGGLSREKCRSALKAFILSFDQVAWNGNDGQRYTVLWVISPEVPYFASTQFSTNPRENTPGIIKSCATTQLPYQGQRIKVTQCDEIKDFTFGQ